MRIRFFIKEISRLSLQLQTRKKYYFIALNSVGCLESCLGGKRGNCRKPIKKAWPPKTVHHDLHFCLFSSTVKILAMALIMILNRRDTHTIILTHRQTQTPIHLLVASLILSPHLWQGSLQNLDYFFLKNLGWVRKYT